MKRSNAPSRPGGRNMTFDPADVVALSELEKAARTFQTALETAAPAFDRLEVAKYAGTDRVGYLWSEVDEWLGHLAESLEDMRIASGDEITWGFRDLARWPA